MVPGTGITIDWIFIPLFLFALFLASNRSWAQGIIVMLAIPHVHDVLGLTMVVFFTYASHLYGRFNTEFQRL